MCIFSRSDCARTPHLALFALTSIKDVQSDLPRRFIVVDAHIDILPVELSTVMKAKDNAGRIPKGPSTSTVLRGSALATAEFFCGDGSTTRRLTSIGSERGALPIRDLHLEVLERDFAGYLA